jgi:hypothetical protein
MKIKTTYQLLIVTLLVLAFYSCKKEVSYDWKNIEPGKQMISGPDSIKGNDSTVYQYLAIPRGGSAYTWEVLRGPITIKVDTSDKNPLLYHPYNVEIKANSTADTSASFVVHETTWAGKTGESDTFTIQKIFCYIPFDMENFMGEYRCREEKTNFIANTFFSLSFTVNITNVGGNTIYNDNFYNLQIQVPFVMSLDKNESIKVVKTLTEDVGDNDFSGPTYITGSGYYSMCNRTMTIKYAIIDAAIGDTIMAITDYFIHK